MITKTYDVLIAGAGPAGASAAIKLAQSGLQVGLFDKATFPRDKTCGDALGVDVINQLKMLSDTLVEKFEKLENKIASYGVKIFSPDHNHIDIPYISNNENSCGYISPRIDFDNLLFEDAKKFSNIRIHQNCTVSDAQVKPDAAVLNTSEGTFTGKIIVGADGAHSIVSKTLGKIKVEKKHYSAGLRVYYENVTSFHHQGFIELHFFRDVLPGYLWVFPLANNKANVGLCVLSSVVSKKKMNLKETLQKLLKTNDHLRDRFREANALETIKGYGLPLGSKKRNLSGERFLLAGDAASLIDPFTGEGIANAIRSGRFAAKHIINCFEEKNFSAAYNKTYDNEIYSKMGKEFKVSRTLQKVVRYPTLLNFVIKKARRSIYLQKLLTDALANVEIKKSVLLKPSFYYQVFFK